MLSNKKIIYIFPCTLSIKSCFLSTSSAHSRASAFGPICLSFFQLLDTKCCCGLPTAPAFQLASIRIVSAFRPQGFPGPTSKIVAACPSPDGLARDGTKGGKTVARVILRQRGCACSRGYKRSRGRERERASLFVSLC
jgi:hypothetical protein